ncbi:Dam family site-specific DNA-(adenine-N6)-methyltransferase [Undibacterium oligocarboniphilum]|uniref:Site-specific DNA-methyltransferase (adenine-specific) n=1 Tax=Undibacterium oligocarboniphilum TaxID=666702 RepID=A0A850QJ43_9BURK|nr:Dam family site-specific DNA-(adenine-N6)-methyltransferase [Undibacterium oligocarboniphilum]MBC3871141.1 Dam family site-specific DNA-(adenine-N6)-methyltransferase [Undibacterium oligocarboniphilum]NVO76236.1 Dam family site-specific DNA-(adenine-N6)-methyltransferase [Undibacterium oligocarboniphilum]
MGRVSLFESPQDLTLAKPLLKWAGGKTQLLGEIIPKMPKKYGRYIEPFFGGGAVFFAARPENGIIADSNPELVNLYRTVATDVDGVIAQLRQYENTEDVFYAVRALDVTKLSNVEAAARTIFLNRTCFNGLYRVNKTGQFNVPFGRYKNPKIIDEDALQAASVLLSNTTIICGDYKTVLQENAQAGDFIFLDPPYLPISEYADFKRYTKEQFYEEDHVELAEEVERLHQLGCHVILTNSNHPLVHEQYAKFNVEVIQTKRYISCNGKGRTGEDVIVNVLPKPRFDLRLVPSPLPQQATLYPPTRYMGSKNKLLAEIWAVASQFEFDTAIDLFSGSGVVSYMLKSHGKAVISNDYMAMSATFTKAMVENKDITLTNEEALALLEPPIAIDHFVEQKFQGLYFTDEENRLIDVLRANIKALKNPYKRAIAMSALIRACFKKRPRGIFTYVGHRYDDGRKDLSMTFRAQFLEAVDAVNNAVFDNGQECKSRNGDAMTLKKTEPGLVYIDPPYYSPLSDNEYVRRYHFVEGLARDWKGVEIQEHTITKKFKSYPTPFSSRKGAAEAFNILFKHFRESVLVVSYSSNSQPTLDEMVSIMAKHKSHVEVVPVDYKYSIGNQGSKVGDNKNDVQEYIFVGY